MSPAALKRPVMIMAGGTGGHVYPALAVAEALAVRGVPVVWLGTPRGLEARVVPARGLPMEWIEITGWRGKGLATRLAMPLRLVRACWQAARALRRRRPAVVLGMGGFVTGPGGLTAWLMRAPLLIHEQNSVAGLTNRWLAPLARQVMEAFPGSFARRGRAPRRFDPVFTGNPVRADIVALPEPAARLAGRTGPLRVLVLGGSQGARALNERVPEALARIPAARRPTVRHQVGERHLDAARDAYEAAGVEARLEPFVEDMAEAYGWADLVVCRAGALTVAELAAAGAAAVLVPYPHAVDDHQTGNARYLTRAGAAFLMPEAVLTPARLASLIEALAADRSAVQTMAEAARDRAMPRAAEAVSEACVVAADGPAASSALDRAEGGERR